MVIDVLQVDHQHRNKYMSSLDLRACVLSDTMKIPTLAQGTHGTVSGEVMEDTVLQLPFIPYTEKTVVQRATSVT
jgi:hypothetical protein